MVQCLVVLVISMVMYALMGIIDIIIKNKEKQQAYTKAIARRHAKVQEALWAPIRNPPVVMDPRRRNDSVIYRERTSLPSMEQSSNATRVLPTNGADNTPTAPCKIYPRGEVV